MLAEERLHNVIRSSQAVVRSGRYAYLKTQTPPTLGNHFLVAQDQDEVTVVTEEANVAQSSFEEDVKWFKLIEVQVSQPFVVQGFIASIARAIAQEKLNILVVSTFSKDYFLIREQSIDIAVTALRNLGFPLAVEGPG